MAITNVNNVYTPAATIKNIATAKHARPAPRIRIVFACEVLRHDIGSGGGFHQGHQNKNKKT
jgi:hypothetical protein